MTKVLLLNPSRRENPATRSEKRRKKNKQHHVKGYYPNPSARGAQHKPKHRRKHRRNPISGGFIKNRLGTALVGTGGALANDWLWKIGSQYLPAAVQTGNGAVVGKVLLSIGAGLLVERFKFLKVNTIERAVDGACTVALYGATRAMIDEKYPGALGDAGEDDGFDDPYKGLAGAWAGASLADANVTREQTFSGAGMGEFLPMGEYLPQNGMGSYFDDFQNPQPSAYTA